jgi:hypothetical protein
MANYFQAAKIYSSKLQNALGTQFLIFVAFDNDDNKNGIFLVDLGSLPTLDPNDQDGLANAIKQNMKKLVFEGDNNPLRHELTINEHQHIMFEVNGNDNILCIGWAINESQRNYILTLAALRSRPDNSSNSNTIKFEKCPNASRRIENIDLIDDLKVLVIGNDPKLHHIAKNNANSYSVEMAGH